MKPWVSANSDQKFVTRRFSRAATREEIFVMQSAKDRGTDGVRFQQCRGVHRHWACQGAHESPATRRSPPRTCRRLPAAAPALLAVAATSGHRSSVGAVIAKRLDKRTRPRFRREPRLSKDYERTVASSETWIRISIIPAATLCTNVPCCRRFADYLPPT
jgi:hypothetical protein